MGKWQEIQAWAAADQVKNRAQMRKAWGDFTGDVAKIAAEAREDRQETRTTKTRIGAGTHSIHATMTLFTCGAWLPVWIVHALLKRGKTTTR